MFAAVGVVHPVDGAVVEAVPFAHPGDAGGVFVVGGEEAPFDGVGVVVFNDKAAEFGCGCGGQGAEGEFEVAVVGSAGQQPFEVEAHGVGLAAVKFGFRGEQQCPGVVDGDLPAAFGFGREGDVFSQPGFLRDGLDEGYGEGAPSADGAGGEALDGGVVGDLDGGGADALFEGDFLVAARGEADGDAEGCAAEGQQAAKRLVA